VRSSLILSFLLFSTACTTAVRTSTTAAAPAEVSIRITNTLGTAVNAYYASDGTDHLIGEVASNSTRSFPIRGLRVGTTVNLRAVRVDGSTAYTRVNFRLGSTSTWTVP